MKNDIFCIIAVGYSRPQAMKRLLQSLVTADYLGDTVDLLVSIDKGKLQKEVYDAAESIEWKFGEKRIREFDERQGLRNHILQCGDAVENYKAVIVLEDDITVSRAFYSYAKQCCEKYGGCEKIAGISLYKHKINVGVGHFFEPDYAGHDVFMMQYAQSWGQCWTKEMWFKFRNWYNLRKDDVFIPENAELLNRIPDNILNWGEQSWMKYYMAYIVENDLYFVYPYWGLSTNHSEAGQHSNTTSCDYQIEMNQAILDYKLPAFQDSIKYDIFFERIGLEIKEFEDSDVILDLYGNRKTFPKNCTLISTRLLDFKILKKWRMKYRPQEMNCVFPEEGNDIYVYDTSSMVRNSKEHKTFSRTKYDVRAISWRKLLQLGVEQFLDALCEKLRRK